MVMNDDIIVEELNVREKVFVYEFRILFVVVVSLGLICGWIRVNFLKYLVFFLYEKLMVV